MKRGRRDLWRCGWRRSGEKVERKGEREKEGRESTQVRSKKKRRSEEKKRRREEEKKRRREEEKKRRREEKKKEETDVSCEQKITTQKKR